MSDKPYRKYGAGKGLPKLRRRRKSMAEKETSEEKEAPAEKAEPKEGKKYDGGPIPKKGSSSK